MNPTTLTTTGGGTPSGTMNVRILCNCTENNGMAVDVVRWYDTAGTRLGSARSHSQFNPFNPNVPYFTRVGGDIGENIDNTNTILVIPTFNDSYDGTYTCGRNATDRSALTPPTANVTLTIIISELIITISYLYVHT